MNIDETHRVSKVNRRALLSTGVAVAGAALTGGLAKAAAPSQPIYRSELGDITIALGGDTMPTRSLKPFVEPEYSGLLDVVRGADYFACNLETTVRNDDEGVGGSSAGGTPMTTPPRILEDLKWMGIDAVSYANNHVGDYGQAGMLAAIKHMHQANFPFAGGGASLTEARRPVYVDTRGGRVGLIAAAATGAQFGAGDPRGDVPTRPGLNPLRYSFSYEVDAPALAELKRIDKELGFAQQRVRNALQFYADRPEEKPNEIRFAGLDIKVGSKFSSVTRVNRGDADANIRWIKEAQRMSDWQVFSLHNHEFGPGGRLTAGSDTTMEDPADFWVDFARSAVDAGVDAVFGHGPHVTLGIEIYKGRPIFYSLGNFIFQNDTIEAVPSEAYRNFGIAAETGTPADFMDARSGNGTRSFEIEAEYWESVIPVCDFRGKQLREVRLHPIDLGFGRSRAERGRPVLARGEKARKILQRVIEKSRRFGTQISIEKEVGLIKVG